MSQQKEYEKIKYNINKINICNLIIITTVLSYAIIGTTIHFSVSAITVFFGPLYLAELIMVAGFAYLIFIIPIIVVAYRIISLPGQ